MKTRGNKGSLAAIAPFNAQGSPGGVLAPPFRRLPLVKMEHFNIQPSLRAGSGSVLLVYASLPEQAPSSAAHAAEVEAGTPQGLPPGAASTGWGGRRAPLPQSTRSCERRRGPGCQLVRLENGSPWETGQEFGDGHPRGCVALRRSYREKTPSCLEGALASQFQLADVSALCWGSATSTV